MHDEVQAIQFESGRVACSPRTASETLHQRNMDPRERAAARMVIKGRLNSTIMCCQQSRWHQHDSGGDGASAR